MQNRSAGNEKIYHYTFRNPFDLVCASLYLQYKIPFLLFVKINVAFLLPCLLLCTVVLLWLLSVPFISKDDEIRAVCRSTFSSAASITAAIAASAAAAPRLLLWFPKRQSESQAISFDLLLAPTRWLIHTICVVSGNINLYHYCFRSALLTLCLSVRFRHLHLISAFCLYRRFVWIGSSSKWFVWRDRLAQITQIVYNLLSLQICIYWF